MTNPNFTALAVVLDRSGSMLSIREDMENGLNEFVKEQKKQPGYATLALTKFDGEIEISPSKNLQEWGAITLEPRGSTALYDALGRTIDLLGAEFRDMPENQRPGKVVVVVVTDGLENWSKQFNKSTIRQMVTTQRETYNWEFVFLGANQDAVLTGVDLGFERGSTLTYATSASGVAYASASLNNYVTTTRSGITPEFSQTDRDNAVDNN